MTMKTRWNGLLVLIISVSTAVVALHPPNGQSANAQDGAPDKSAQKSTADSKTRAPHTCPMIPIEVYGSESLYEANFYADDTCSSPTLTYAFGAFSYPQTCPNCLTYGSSQPFYGQPMPVPADYEHTMPAGRPRKYSKKALTPDRIRHLYLDKQGVYVRVFSFHVNRADMASGDEPDDPDFKETIHFAFECSDPASIGVDPAQIKVIYANKQRPVPDPGGAPTTVYDVTYDYAGGPAHILTILCGDPKPPIDQVVPVAADQ